ncbi:hypothetical protein HOH87_01360 [bacterium]|nr:hypothetical protein [bacterium]
MGKKQNILLIGDDTHPLNGFCEVLAPLSCEVFRVYSFESALGLCLTYPMNLVICCSPTLSDRQLSLLKENYLGAIDYYYSSSPSRLIEKVSNFMVHAESLAFRAFP